MYGQHIESLEVCFLDWNYHYKLVATQIPHDVGLAPIIYTDQKLFPTRDQTGVNPVENVQSSKL
jgi:hypothetical protein